MSLKNIWILIRAAAASWADDYAQSMGAALAYYTIFSTAPLLLIVIAVAGLIFGVDAARGEIVAQLQGLMGREGAETVQGLIESAGRPAASVTATVVGGVLLLITSTTVFDELQHSLDRIWRAPKRRQDRGWNWLRKRLLSFAMILAAGLLLMLSLLFSGAMAALKRSIGSEFAEWSAFAGVINFLFSHALSTTVFAIIYKVVPGVKVAWTDVWIGAVVTALLFTTGNVLIGAYIGQSGLTSAFGAAGSLLVSLVWVYYSAQIFLMGAEFTWAYAVTFGSRKGEGGDASPDARIDQMSSRA